MSAKWPTVMLKDLMKLSLDRKQVDPSKSFNVAGVFSFGKGLFKRSPVLGGETTFKVFNRLNRGDFVISQLKAWEGALAEVTEEFDGWYLSPNFPTFRPVPGKLNIKFFAWYCKQPRVWNELKRVAKGMGARRETVSPDSFLSLSIPFPPLDDQRRIAVWLDQLYAKNGKACTIRTEIQEATHQLLSVHIGKVFAGIAKDYPPLNLGSYNPFVTSGPRNWANKYGVDGIRFYRAQDIGPRGDILSGNKVFVNPPDGAQGRSAILKQGDILLVITGATVGRVALYRQGLEPGLVSQHVAICRLPSSALNPEYVCWALRGPRGQEQLLGQRYGQGKPGLNLTNIRMLSIPVPPIDEQHRVVAKLESFQGAADRLRRTQETSGSELDALMPSILSRTFGGKHNDDRRDTMQS